MRIRVLGGKQTALASECSVASEQMMGKSAPGWDGNRLMQLHSSKLGTLGPEVLCLSALEELTVHSKRT